MTDRDWAKERLRDAPSEGGLSAGGAIPKDDKTMGTRRVETASGIVASAANASSRRWLDLLTASAVFVTPFYLFNSLILYHFYVQGGLLIDTGLLGSLMWRIGPSLPVPPWYGEGSFFAVHVAPLTLLASAVSEVLPLTMPQTFAAFVGTSLGLLALAIFALLASGDVVRHRPTLFLAALASVGFACTGLALAIALFPHFEMFGAACLLLSFAALARERWALGAVWFLLALFTREDVGLHAFVFLSLWAAANWRRDVPWRRNRWIVRFAFAGLFYSAFVMLGQHLVFPGHSTFVAVYVGDPPFGHLSWRLIATRLQGWAEVHTSSIALPTLGVVAWTFWKRGRLVRLHRLHPLGDLAVAFRPRFLGRDVGLLCLSVRDRNRVAADRWPDPSAAAGAAGRPLGSLCGDAGAGRAQSGADRPRLQFGQYSLPRAMLFPPWPSQQLATDRAVAALATAPPALGRLLVDDSVAALQTFSFTRRDIALLANARSNTVAYFQHGMLAASLRERANLPHHYVVTGTEIRIDTDRSPDAVQRLGVLAEPARWRAQRTLELAWAHGPPAPLAPTERLQMRIRPLVWRRTGGSLTHATGSAAGAAGRRALPTVSSASFAAPSGKG
jgi:hypothetical protein